MFSQGVIRNLYILLHSGYNMKGLTKLLVDGAIIASAIFPGKLGAQDNQIIDPFSTPNRIYTEYTGHGGGNINQDEEDIIDWDDYDAMETMPSHISDIDGDGFPSTDNDKKILADYLNGIIAYLPGHWNRLQTRQEREDWAKKEIINIYKVDHRIWDENSDPLLSYVSGNYKTDICIGLVGHILEGLDYFGDPKIPIFDKYSNKENNGKGNLPVFGVQRVRDYLGHGMNAILVGDNPLEFTDWLFYEPQTNKFVDIRKNEVSGEFVENEIYIEFFHNFYDLGQVGQNDTQMRAFPRPVIFDTEEGTGNVTVRWVDPMTVLTRPTVAIEDENNTNISDKYVLKQNFPNPFNSSTTIHFDIPLNPPSKGDNGVETLHATSLQLVIYDISGKELATLAENISKSGSYKVEWNASGYPSGIYFYQLQSNYDVMATRKMLYLK